MRWLLWLDVLVARSRSAWLWIGQLALLSLGVHLAADHLDDATTSTLRRLPIAWPDVDTPRQIGTWFAVACELLAVGWGTWSLACARAEPVRSLRAWLQRVSLHALLAPAGWLSLALAGTWCIAMAVEDALAEWVLPASSLGAQGARGAGLAASGLVLWRLVGPAMQRLVRCTPVPRRRLEGALWLPVLLILLPYAWRYGLPVWSLGGDGW